MLPKCYFDPRKACGSGLRSKLAYERAALVRLAGNCGIPRADDLDVDTLCALLREQHFEQRRGEDLVQLFRNMKDSRNTEQELGEDQTPEPATRMQIALPVPDDGSLTTHSALALMADRRAMRQYARVVRATRPALELSDSRRWRRSVAILLPKALEEQDPGPHDEQAERERQEALQQADLFRAKMLLLRERLAN